MMKWIKKIFDNSNEHNSGIVGTQSTSWSQMCKCCFCQPIKSIRPPSHSQFLQASKNCKKINKENMSLKRCPNFLGNQTTVFIKIANQGRAKSQTTTHNN